MSVLRTASTERGTQGPAGGEAEDTPASMEEPTLAKEP